MGWPLCVRSLFFSATARPPLSAGPPPRGDPCAAGVNTGDLRIRGQSRIVSAEKRVCVGTGKSYHRWDTTLNPSWLACVKNRRVGAPSRKNPYPQSPATWMLILHKPCPLSRPVCRDPFPPGHVNRPWIASADSGWVRSQNAANGRVRHAGAIAENSPVQGKDRPMSPRFRLPTPPF